MSADGFNNFYLSLCNENLKESFCLLQRLDCHTFSPVLQCHQCISVCHAQISSLSLYSCIIIDPSIQIGF
jgi:hypothetical protein